MTEERKDYRALRYKCLEDINFFKKLEIDVAQAIKERIAENPEYDQGMIPHAVNHLMMGFMLLNRAIANPSNPYQLDPPSAFDYASCGGRSGDRTKNYYLASTPNGVGVGLGEPVKDAFIDAENAPRGGCNNPFVELVTNGGIDD